MFKQVRTGAELHTKATTQGISSLKGTAQGSSPEMPRLRRTSLQVCTGTDLLSDPSQIDMLRSDMEGSQDQHPKMAKDPLSQPSQEASQRRPRTKAIPLQVGTSADLLTKQSWEVIRPLGQYKKTDRPQSKIYI